MNARSDSLAAPLAAWFTKNARPMPWRSAPAPYLVWVSEIMLQQTQVATVIPFFNRFTARFPNVHALASATEDDVLALWSGLGYYRRARLLHSTAIKIVREHAGSFPSSRAAVMELPGVGRYTAGAILSIAFDQPEPVVDGNVERVFARLNRYRTNLKSAAGQRAVWKWAETAVRDAAARGLKPSVFNQALMELGATICAPRDPRCAQCPISRHCISRAQGVERRFPVKSKAPKAKRIRYLAVIAQDRRGRVLLVRRNPDEPSLWPDGLWELPHAVWSGKEMPWEELCSRFGLRPAAPGVGLNRSRQRFFKPVKHSIMGWRLEVSVALGAPLKRARRVSQRWYDIRNLSAVPMAGITRKLLNAAYSIASMR